MSLQKIPASAVSQGREEPVENSEDGTGAGEGAAVTHAEREGTFFFFNM